MWYKKHKTYLSPDIAKIINPKFLELNVRVYLKNDSSESILLIPQITAKNIKNTHIVISTS